MKIINDTANSLLWNAGLKFCVGYISGPVRMAGGIIQTIINLAAAIFLLIPSIWIKPTSQWNAFHLMRDCSYGVMHIVRGLIEFLPFSSIILAPKKSSGVVDLEEGRQAFWKKLPHRDHPFKLDTELKDV